ncbi:MAG: response regulator [Coprothermobacterota bacterium]|nr:response regulator [Coprothermobacterota bacterium]
MEQQMDSGRILVVDDSQANLRVLDSVLRAAGYQVYPADSGELALAAIQAHPAELILLDIRMPGMDGFQVCRRLKEQENTCAIPVIFLSAATEVEERVEGLRLGAVDFISKPFRPEELLARVSTHLQLSRSQARLERQAAELQSLNTNLQAEIDDRKRAETALRHSERRYRELVENLAEGVAIIDKADAFLYLNPACERIFGLPAVDLLGHNLKEFIDPAEHEAVDRQAALRQNVESSQYENTIIRPNGSRRRLLVSSVPQYDGQGEVSGTLSIILDITEQRAVEEAIQKARTDLLFAVSHEMKTPLMSLAASREILETLSPAERERRTPEYEAMWAHNLARLRRLIDNLVDSQRTQTIGMQLVHEPSDLNDLVRGVLAETASLSASRDLRLTLSLAELPTLHVDREAISRLLENLVTNAIKYSPRGGLITLCTTLEDDHACLTITDQGSGITAEEMASLFQPFQRTPRTVKSGVQGTGLGLYVSKMIAEAHGGSVELESQPGQGTTVRVRLPLHTPE